MKIITTGDWHIGNLFHGNDRLSEHKHFLNWLLSRLEEHQPDALLIAGDIFDTANPSAAAQSVYYDFLAEATRKCPDLKIVISAGNHDSAFRLEAPRALLTKHNVEVRGRVNRNWMQEENGGAWIFDYDDLMIPLTGKEDDKAVILVVPYLRNDIMTGGNYSQGVNKFLREITIRAREKYPDTPLVMMTHMYAKGSDIAKEDASEKIIIGGLEEVNLEGWEAHPDYLTSGHIHKRQHIWNTAWARYTGSVLPMSFAEVDHRHGVDLVTISSGRKPVVDFLEYNPQHKLRILPEGEEGLSPQKLLKLIKKELSDRGENGELDDDFVYLLLKVKQEKINNDEIKQLESLVQTKNAVLCKIQKVVTGLHLTTLSQERDIISVDDIINRDPLETLKESFRVEHNRDMSEHQESMLASLLETISRE